MEGGRRSAQPGGLRLGLWLHVLQVLTLNDFRARYRAQALGVVWSLLNPLVMMGILSIIFTQVFHAQVAHFPVFMLIGLVVWQWVSNSLPTATQMFVQHADVVKRTVFPRQLLPVAAVLSYGINFLLESLLLVAAVFVFPSAYKLSPALLLVPLLLVLLMALLVGLALATSVLNVIYRDVAYLVSTSLMLLYWLTPIIYPVEVVPQPFRTLLQLNPLGGIIVALRHAIMDGQAPTALGWLAMLLPVSAVLACGWAIFRHYERMVLDYV